MAGWWRNGPIARLIVVMAVIAVPGCASPAVRDPAACAPRDTRVATPYPIGGYWVVPRSDACVTRRTVEAVHALGGDTLVTFGPRLTPAGVDAEGRVLLPDGGVDPQFAGCVDAGRTCYQAAVAALAAVPGGKIRRVYGYAVNETFGAGVLRCPKLDRRIVSGGRTYYRLLLGDSCSADRFDLVLVATDGDGVGNLMTEAAAYGMKVYAGLPAAPQDPAKPWLPDLTHTKALDALTERVLAGYRQRFAALPSFAGVYQSFELSMKERPDDDPTISLYRAQNAVAAAALPGKKLLVSPYFDARRKQGFPPDKVAGGMADVAATRAGMPLVVAVQDGRGTGKGTVYQADQVDVKVDPRLVPVVGDVTNRQAYYGSTRDYIAAAARAVPAGVELWANIEAFEPTPASGECGRANPMPLRGRTTRPA